MLQLFEIASDAMKGKHMKSKDVTMITTENPADSMRKAVENSVVRVRDMELQTQKAEHEEQELERQLQEAELVNQQKKETVEKGQETERKIAEVGGG